jgi:acetyl esterase/lipase
MSSLSPLPNPTLPLPTRIYYYACLLSLRILFRVFFNLRSIFKAPAPPTLVKSYPSTPQLRNRIFYPPTYTSSSDRLPLYLSIHGGGFVFGYTSMDDTVNTKVCSDWNVLVISLDYPKTPTVRYPVPIQQLVATILSIFADDSLPFDRDRVAIGGYSAGGELALSVCLDPQLKGKIHVVIPFYPVTDNTISATVRRDTRPYRYKGEMDGLVKFIPILQYGYIPAGQDLREPRLSPGFAAREDLPAWICTVGAELDILCNEAGAMMGRLAGKQLVKVGETVGLGGQDRDGFEADGGRLKWTLVKGARHGFTHQQAKSKQDKEKMTDSDKVFKALGEWLLNGPFRVGK